MKKIVLLIAILVAFTMCFSTVKAATQAQIDTSIAHGLAWLAGQQNADGSWGLNEQVARTGLAVKKFEHRALTLGKSPLDPTYQYYPQVKNGLNYLFSTATITPISPQPAGNPDSDGDGIGVAWGGGETYHTSIALMAIAESNCPDSVVNVPGSPVNGWTYRHVAIEAVDYLSFGQNDAGTERGGWGYFANDIGWSDNSNSGYAAMGLAYAQAGPPDGFSIPIPGFVKTELKIWILFMQCTDPGPGPMDGGASYSSTDGPCNWVNTYKTGNLLVQMALTGQYAGTNRDRAVAYLVRHWSDANTDPGWQIHYQAMYGIMKGLEFQGISIMSGIDWYEDFSDSIVFYQHLDGSWGPDVWGDVMLATTWALLTLERAAPPPEFNIPDQCILSGQVFAQFDADTFVTTGTPPFTWTWSGNVNLTVTKDANNVFTITYPSGWTGSETITFHATDALGMTWDDNATFTVDPAPVVGNIPDQIAPFVPINLDTYLSGINPSLVTWSASGMNCLVVGIDPLTHVATVTNPGDVCTQPETICFVATAIACGEQVRDGNCAIFTPTLPVVIDIKPQSCPNPFNMGSNGVLPVAILGTMNFNVRTVNPATVRLEGVAPVRWNYENVSTPVPPGPDTCACTTLGADRYMDLTLKFDHQAIAAALGMVHDREIRVLTLTGRTTSGMPIRGQDCVIILKKGHSKLSAETPSEFSLSENYPNPFNPETEISFSLPERTQVSLVIYNMLGEKVKTLVNQTMNAGTYSAHWNGKDESGNSLASGIYFYRLETESFDQTRKMVLMK